MVTTAVRVEDIEDVSQNLILQPVLKTETASDRMMCARCNTRLLMNYDEPQCLNCGYVDYSHVNESNSHKRQNLMSAATRYVLRYTGDFQTLRGTLAQVRLVRIRNRIGFEVNCPFCNNIMQESSLSGKRPEVREQRYKCVDGHRVSLVPTKNGMLGWR